MPGLTTVALLPTCPLRRNIVHAVHQVLTIAIDTAGVATVNGTGATCETIIVSGPRGHYDRSRWPP